MFSYLRLLNNDENYTYGIEYTSSQEGIIPANISADGSE